MAGGGTGPQRPGGFAISWPGWARGAWPAVPVTLAGRFPVGASVTRDQLNGDVYPVLHRLRVSEPVSWLPVLGGWLVTRHDVAVRVLRDSRGFTVDDPRFTTARVVGPSM